MLCEEFECWFNIWRAHMTLEGFRPDDIYYNKKPKKPKRDSKGLRISDKSLDADVYYNLMTFGPETQKGSHS
jgi:hypothetical protein